MPFTAALAGVGVGPGGVPDPFFDVVATGATEHPVTRISKTARGRGLNKKCTELYLHLLEWLSGQHQFPGGWGLSGAG
jgi:hypothetical protein